MAFSQETIDQAWRRAGGKCECTLKNCGHTGKRNKYCILDCIVKYKWIIYRFIFSSDYSWKNWYYYLRNIYCFFYCCKWCAYL